MGITFNIESQPPTADDIEAVRKQILVDKAALERKDWKFFFGIIAMLFTMAGTAITFGPQILEEGENPTTIAAVILFTPYTLFFAFAFVNTARHDRIDVPRKQLRADLALLADAPPEEAESFAVLAIENNLIAAYQKAIATQGRAVLQGEVDAALAHRATLTYVTPGLK